MARSRNKAGNSADSDKLPRFLEPLYINETMVLNSAAYLFKGTHTTVDSTEMAQERHSGGFGARIPGFGMMFDANVKGERSSGWEERISKQLTLGAIHMNVLDKLNELQMVTQVNIDKLQGSMALHENYVECQGILYPNDYHALLHTIDVAWPLVVDMVNGLLPILEDAQDSNSEFSDQGLVQAANAGSIPQIIRHIDNHGKSVGALVERLSQDYFTSQQMEMVLRSKDGKGRAVAVIDLNVSDYDPAVLRAQLSGGRYHIIGKVVRAVDSGSTISMFDKSILGAVYDLIKRIMLSRRDSAALAKFDKQLHLIQRSFQPLMTLEVNGPALRIAAMSVSL